MGSLAAFLSRGGSPDAAVVERMLRAAPHRGSALATAGKGRSLLGISNTPDHADAWLAEANRLAVAFTGTLDNKHVLDRELERDGAAALGDDPASTVLAAFDAWGDTAPRRLRGAFAGVVTDGSTIRCFRDQIGFEPLFCHDGGEGFFAATEAKQVLAGSGLPREPDLDAVAGILFEGTSGRRTALRAVDRVPKASLLAASVDDGSPSLARYWDPAELVETARLTPQDARERLVELLDQAVRRTVTNDTAVMLSGGIDSPTVAAFAAPAYLERTRRPLRACSFVYPHLPSVDERRYTELVANYLGVRLDARVPTARWLDRLTFWTQLTDSPVHTLSIPEVAEIYAIAASSGARTLLGGELAEYVFTMEQNLLAHLVLHGRWTAAATRLRARRSRGHPWLSQLRQLALEMAPPAMAGRYVRWRRRGTRNVPPWAAGGLADLHTRPFLSDAARRRWMNAQLSPLRGDGSVTLEADAISASYCGLRVRRPLADVDLWEFVLSLPAETKLPYGLPKTLLREAMRGRLPEEILSRRDKTVFDDHIVATAEYPELRRRILGSQHRVAGIDYKQLAARLEREDLNAMEIQWARDVASAHAFLDSWN